jgi:hypothetical protein
MIDMKQEKKRVNKLRADTNITMDTLKYGDKVQFSRNGKNGIQGTIIVKDYQGGGLYYAICPSVDIQGEDSILYKHVPIVDVELVN